jgi:hypothetical protein
MAPLLPHVQGACTDRQGQGLISSSSKILHTKSPGLNPPGGERPGCGQCSKSYLMSRVRARTASARASARRSDPMYGQSFTDHCQHKGQHDTDRVKNPE